MTMRIGASLAVIAFVLVGVDWHSPALGQNQTGPENAYHSQVDLVSVYFTVRDDKKRLVSDLGQDRFTVAEDEQQQAIKFFAHHSDVVLNVGVLLDTGTNMSRVLGEEAEASKMFLRHVVRPTDLGFLVSYASRVETVQLPTSDIALLRQAADSIGSGGAAIGLHRDSPSEPTVSLPGGGTVGINGRRIDDNRSAHLYDALRVSTHRYLAGEVGRKAVVVVALSGDAHSESTLQDALEALLENDVIAYVLQIYDASKHDNCDVLHIYGKDSDGVPLLKKLAEATGGRMLEVRGIDKLEDALDEISDELHHQYSLGYYPENKNWDGKFRKIQISAGEKGYKVYARKGYYAKPPAANVAATQ
ncbi:MAG: VWA domain-containing protein [Candidatus Acidiferrum sp.]